MRTLILLTALLVGCPSDEPLIDAPTPTPEDEPRPPPEPLEGDWDGDTNGVVLYGQVGSYPCEGTGFAEVDAEDRAWGNIVCTFPHSGDVCEFEFEDVLVDGGQRPTEFSDCFGDGEATHSLWAANGSLYGRVQRLSEVLSVEVFWALDPAEEGIGDP